MRAVSVTAPDETRWTVRIAWKPRWQMLAHRFGGWRRRRKERRVDIGDAVDVAGRVGDAGMSDSSGGGGFDLGEAMVVLAVVFFAVIAAAGLFWWVLLPLLLVVLDLAIVLILLVGAVVGRVLFRRPWTVEATATSGERFTVNVVGWRAAQRKRDELSGRLRGGEVFDTATLAGRLDHPVNVGSGDHSPPGPGEATAQPRANTDPRT